MIFTQNILSCKGQMLYSVIYMRIISMISSFEYSTDKFPDCKKSCNSGMIDQPKAIWECCDLFE